MLLPPLERWAAFCNQKLLFFFLSLFFFLARSLRNSVKTKTRVQISGFITGSPNQETSHLLCNCMWPSQRSIQSHSTARLHVFWTLGAVLMQSLPGKPHSAKQPTHSQCKCGQNHCICTDKWHGVVLLQYLNCGTIRGDYYHRLIQM